jgi:hypothetical protein
MSDAQPQEHKPYLKLSWVTGKSQSHAAAEDGGTYKIIMTKQGNFKVFYTRRLIGCYPRPATPCGIP